MWMKSRVRKLGGFKETRKAIRGQIKNVCLYPKSNKNQLKVGLFFLNSMSSNEYILIFKRSK